MNDPLERLPHRVPFRFVTRIQSIEQGVAGRAVWDVSGDEDFFRGHFPGEPVVPGVLIGEALAQFSGVVGIPPKADRAWLAHMEVKFLAPVAPPAEIVLDSRLVRSIRHLTLYNVEALVGGKPVAKGRVTLASVGKAK